MAWLLYAHGLLLCSDLTFGQYYYYTSPRRTAHKALIFSFRVLQFSARNLTVIHGCHPAVGHLPSEPFTSKILLVNLDKLLTFGFHSIAVTECSFLSFLSFLIWLITSEISPRNCKLHHIHSVSSLVNSSGSIYFIRLSDFIE